LPLSPKIELKEPEEKPDEKPDEEPGEKPEEVEYR
jgi:hypothetical protein